MTTLERNTIFEQYCKLIHFTISKHRGLLEAMRVEVDDMRQELAISLLRAIERFDPQKGTKPSTYYIKMLQYALLNQWRAYKRDIRLANNFTTPFCSTDENGEAVELELPYVVDFDMHVRVGDFMRTLSDGEQSALARTIGGIGKTDKRHKRFMSNVRRKALRSDMIGRDAA